MARASAKATKRAAKKADVGKTDKAARRSKADKVKKPRRGKRAKTEQDSVDLGVEKTAGSAFYGSILDAAEKATRMASNSLRYLDPLSTELLQFDRALSGGFFNVFGSISGQEGSGKTTLIYHGMSSSIKHQVNFCQFIDAEGTLNADFASNVFAQFGLNFRELMDDKSQFRYYRRNVIETAFDLMHFVLKKMPDKVWIPETNSWGYVIPKRNKHFAAFMDNLQLRSDKDLSTDNDYVCPTDNSGIEGAVFLDSLAAFVTESDDEKEERSKIRAAEASAYSLNLKRVVSRIASKGMVLFAVNQLRKVPGQTYGDPFYEPGGEAIKFYSAQRLRIAARAVPEGFGVVRDKDTGQGLEPSVHKDGAMDRYKYQFFKNTKNKVGFPGHSGWVRIWIADAFGLVRGFDPVFDALEYLRNTNQLRTEGRKKGQTLFVFRLRDSAGTKRAAYFNQLPAFTQQTFKRLILAEAEDNAELYTAAAKRLETTPGHLKRAGLRRALFSQVQQDRTILQIAHKAAKEDDDAGDVEEL